MRLNGKRAIVTGAASGFGAGIAKKFIEEGAEVIIADLNEKMAQKVALDLGERAYPFLVDVSKSKSVAKLKDFFIIALWHTRHYRKQCRNNTYP